ncbi:MAG: hypothetical protein HXY53_02140 [Nitrospirae bacterium]|nr:hypothetical protein [Nitrospirota bacterium]
MRYKNISVLFYVSIILVLVSCSEKEVKKVSDDSKIAHEAFKLTDTLKKAYIENDRGTLKENSTEEAFSEIFGSIKPFDNAELIFTPTWVEIQGSTVSVTISWKGTWKWEEKITEERGLAVFVFEGRPLKLIKIKRENPFSYP